MGQRDGSGKSTNDAPWENLRLARKWVAMGTCVRLSEQTAEPWLAQTSRSTAFTIVTDHICADLAFRKYDGMTDD